MTKPAPVSSAQLSRSPSKTDDMAMVAIGQSDSPGNEQRGFWTCQAARQEGGDNLMVPANTAALGSDMTGTAPDGAGRPAGGNPAAPSVPTSGDQPTADPVSDPEGEL